MKVSRGKIPAEALVNDYLPVDYSDVYVCTTAGLGDITPDDIMISFWTVMPKWVNNLFKLRNLLVKPFGLATERNSKFADLERCIRTGGESAIASVPYKSPDETILKLADKHLTAYLSVYIEGHKNVYVTTLVNFQKKFGYIYFYAIYPFHHIIVKRQLKSTISRLVYG